MSSWNYQKPDPQPIDEAMYIVNDPNNWITNDRYKEFLYRKKFKAQNNELGFTMEDIKQLVDYHYFKQPAQGQLENIVSKQGGGRKTRNNKSKRQNKKSKSRRIKSRSSRRSRS